jgi:erythromycin esterase-like protein
MSAQMTFMKYFLGVMYASSVLTLAGADQATAGKLPDGISSVPTLDFNSTNDDLAPFADMVGGSAIVALGESAHTDGSYHKANARLARFLIERQGFRNLFIETPKALSEALGRFVKVCTLTPPGLTTALQGLFSQYNSVELATLYSWVRDFNCRHPYDQVSVIGFDIQAPGADEQRLEQFVQTVATKQKSRMGELQICHPPSKNPWSMAGPTTEKDLATCEKILDDLQPAIDRQSLSARGDLHRAVIALRSSARMARFRSVGDRVASDCARDEGMARMIQSLIADSKPGSKTVLLAHILHVARSSEGIAGFGAKSMGTHLSNWYRKSYVVSVALSNKIATAAWWPFGVYTPSSTSVEGVLSAFGQGNLLINVHANKLFTPSAKVEAMGQKQLVMPEHWDSIMFAPDSVAMTDSPGVQYPKPPPTGADTEATFPGCGPIWALPVGLQVAGQGYQVSCSSGSKHSNTGVTLESHAPHDPFGYVFGCTQILNFAGQITLTARIRTMNVANGAAGLYLQVMSSEGKSLGFKDMSGRGITGTTDWHLYQISIEAPANTSQACFGVVLSGSGSVGFDQLSTASVRR